MARARQRAAGEQHGFAGHRQPGVLEQHAQEHHGVTVPREEIEQPYWHVDRTVSGEGGAGGPRRREGNEADERRSCRPKTVEHHSKC
jgi:hypothetical protein